MARPYSEDLRARLVDAVEAGATRSATARRFGVSVSCVIKLVQRWRRTGSVAPGQFGGQKQSRLAPHESLVRRLVATHPDATNKEIHAALAAAGVRVGLSSVGRFLLALDLTRKKRRSMPPNRNGPTSRRHAKFGAHTSRR